MDTKTDIKRLRVRGMAAVGFSARLKAIGLNVFRAARVKRVREALTAPGTAVPGIRSLIYAVKEHFLSRWHRLSDIFVTASQMRPSRCVTCYEAIIIECV